MNICKLYMRIYYAFAGTSIYLVSLDDVQRKYQKISECIINVFYLRRKCRSESKIRNANVHVYRWVNAKMVRVYISKEALKPFSL